MSDETTPQGDSAMSPASAGSVASDIVGRLVAWRDERGFPTPGEMMDEAAAEIARLRDALDEQTGRAGWNYECLIQRDAEVERLRLTDAEVAAIRLGELACPGLRITDRGKWVDVWATLRGLRERTSGTHATPAQGSVQGQ